MVKQTRKKRKIKRKRKYNKTLKKKNNIRVKTNFQSANIKLLKKQKINDNHFLKLKIKSEPYKKSVKKKFQNWFYFKVENIKEKKIIYKIVDVNNYDDDWKGFNVCYSYDNINWKRTKTNVVKSKSKTDIEWKFQTKNSAVWFAYYPPYTFSRILNKFKNYKTIGYSEKNRPILMKSFGTGSKKIWVISGQHPGETINSWMLEGFMEELHKRKDILKKYKFFILPCANPDGRVMGNWYLNAKGVNLNRDWGDFKSKETKVIKEQFMKYGFDLVIDLHGDEGAKKHFFAHSPKKRHPDHEKINKKINEKNKNFQLENYYIKNGHAMTLANTLDEYTTGITVEGAMKHKLGNWNSLQEEAIQIGRDLLNSL